MSKLYTEYEVRKAIYLSLSSKKVRMAYEEDIFNSLTPIELPTDEEIDEESKIGGMDTAQRLCFQLGAKWMRDKINGGGDE